MKLFASTREEVQRLERGFSYFFYTLVGLIAIASMFEDKYGRAAAGAAYLLFEFARRNGFIPAAWLRPESRAGNIIAVILAAALITLVALVWWSETHGV